MEARKAIPVKPEGVRWTEEQWRAIYERSGNLLISAAAGSGKTAVLVERVIRALLDEEAPTDVDRFLILTFTKAAAGEMKERIRHALEEELVRQPFSAHLRRQLLLLPKASISTFHAFCLDLVKRYAYRLGVDPNFRILDESEAKLMQLEVLEELMEEGYGAGEDGFFLLADWFSDDRSDEPLQDLLLRLYTFAVSQPWPEQALQRMVGLYREAVGKPIDEWPWTASLKQEIERRAAVFRELTEKAIRLCRLPGGPAEYASRLAPLEGALLPLMRASALSWEEIELALQAVPFDRFPSIRRGEAVSEALKDEVKGLRDQVKEGVEGLKSTYFEGAIEERKEELRRILPVVEGLVRQVQLFADRFAEKKVKKGVADFADLEHLTLRLLRDPAAAPEREVPSEAALELREQFTEILVDEFQDTNEVQETILSLLSGEKVRRFMVGDLKQSIYRFRQTEPRLFQEKYERYSPEGNEAGMRIDLVRNFRSRREILEAVNHLFEAFMTKETAGIPYDGVAALRYGLGDEVESHPPQWENGTGEKGVNLYLINSAASDEEEKERSQEEAAQRGENGEEEKGARENDSAGEVPVEELEKAELEARFIAGKIRRLIGAEGNGPYLLYDRKEKRMRPASYRDMVILLRSAKGWDSLFEETFRQLGIPVYVERSGGYFSATEIQVMLSLLQLIDNPYQDIPLASVLRSPIVGLTAEELALIALERRKGVSYYEALKRFVEGEAAVKNDFGETKGDASLGAAAFRGDEPEGSPVSLEEPISPPEAGDDLASGSALSAEVGKAFHRESAASSDEEDQQLLRERLGRFLEDLHRWRTLSRKGALSQLIWQLYRETGYYDFVGGLPGGRERQANLQALYDRARTFEEGAFRGLYRFLRFVERMNEKGEDLGTARALGEQEDVVRIMTIHKSKGLEFPIVFLAGAGKQFNERDLKEKSLFSKELGIGTDVIDLERALRVTSLPKLAVREKERKEMLAEEMRILYVALTRAKEKLFIVGSVPDLNTEMKKWREKRGSAPFPLPSHHVLSARRYLDWILPALLLPHSGEDKPAGVASSASDTSRTAEPTASHQPDFAAHWNEEEIEPVASGFTLKKIPAAQLSGPLTQREMEVRSEIWPYIQALSPIPPSLTERFTAMGGGSVENQPIPKEREEEISAILDWKSPYKAMEMHPAKQSVSEIKRKMQLFAEAEEGTSTLYLRRPRLARRPRFMEEGGLTATEKGTAMHTVMQHIDLGKPITAESIKAQIEEMVAREMLTRKQAESISVEEILRFFKQRIGRRMLAAQGVKREIPFTFQIPASRAYPDWVGEDEPILVQGIIDVIIEEEELLYLLDYKTDRTEGLSDAELLSRYRMQIALYREAIAAIWRRPVARSFLYFFQGERLLEVD